MKEIAEKLKSNFNIEISNISSFRDNYIVLNNTGRMLLKKQVISPERVRFIHNAKQHLISNNFKYVDEFMLTTNNDPFIILNNNLYTLTNILDGQEMNFDNPTDVEKSTQLLADFHISSRGFFKSPSVFNKDELGKLPSVYQKRLDEIKRAKKNAHLGKTKFDYLLLDYIDYFYNLGKEVIEKLSKSRYMDLVSMTQKEGSFCHHEFTHNNIVNKSGTYFLINFEYCCYELKIYDLCNLIKRKLRKCNWDINEAQKILDCYRKKVPLSYDELYVMKLMLMFPQKFWRVINTYYNSKKNLSDSIYLSKLNNVIDEIRPIETFLKKYDVL
ncbi:MAG: CotS family spore coat protein [Clostridiales bacterium]|nr:CotS family spore coat protein [Clostridiales bacterium]